MNTFKLSTEEVAQYLAEHILEGDADDGVPNILSDSNTFVTEGKRQHPLKAERKARLLAGDEIQTDRKLADNYKRNKTLIDLAEIPADIEAGVLAALEGATFQNDRIELVKHLSKSGLREMAASAQDF